MSHSQTHRTLHIPIVNDMEFEKDENFEIELFDATDGAKVGRVNRTAVTITNDDGKEREGGLLILSNMELTYPSFCPLQSSTR